MEHAVEIAMEHAQSRSSGSSTSVGRPLPSRKISKAPIVARLQSQHSRCHSFRASEQLFGFLKSNCLTCKPEISKRSHINSDLLNSWILILVTSMLQTTRIIMHNPRLWQWFVHAENSLPRMRTTVIPTFKRLLCRPWKDVIAIRDLGTQSHRIPASNITTR